MINSALALQKVIQAALNASPELISLIGEEAVLDEVPRNRVFPYISYGEASHADWSTGTEAGTEHSFELNVWSRQRGRKQVLEIAASVETALQDFDPVLDDHDLVNFSHRLTSVTHDEKTGLFRARLAFRAVTEPQLNQN